MKKITGLILLAALLGYGLMRMGVGAALLLHTLDILQAADLATASQEVSTFLSERSDKQIFAFTLTAYYSYILLMGMALTAGAIGVFLLQKWGYVLLWCYLGLHAMLFINYQEINPKLLVLALQTAILISLFFLRPPQSAPA